MNTIQNNIVHCHFKMILDDNGRPFAFTAVEFLDDLDESERTTIEVSSIFDKKCSRSVICQAAMLSRLRSICYNTSSKTLLENVNVVNNYFVASRDFWSNQPTTWNAISDVVLMKRLLVNGFGEALLRDSTALNGQVSFQICLSFYWLPVFADIVFSLFSSGNVSKFLHIQAFK